jgi:hypothetical protein
MAGKAKLEAEVGIEPTYRALQNPCMLPTLLLRRRTHCRRGMYPILHRALSRKHHVPTRSSAMTF